MYDIARLPNSIDIGYTGETGFRTIEIDMSKWLSTMPHGVPSIVHIRPHETLNEAYIANTTFDGRVLRWTISMTDLGGVEGVGTMQVWLEEEANNSLLKRGKSALAATQVYGSIQDPNETIPPARTMILQLLADAVSVGTMEDVDVTATHDQNNVYTLHFKIPKGPKGDKGDEGDPAPIELVIPEVDAFLAANFLNPSNPPLDRSLSSAYSAAPADVVGLIRNKTPEMISSGAQGTDLDIADEDGNVIMRLEEGHIRTSKFFSGNLQDVKTSEAPCDLDIADEDGNVLLRLQDGQVRTKRFYSGDLMGIRSTDSDSDLDFIDQSGNAIMRLVNGGIKTKEFSSDDVNGQCSDYRDYIDYGLENRLANPIFTSFEKYNADHPSAPISVENGIYPNVTGQAGYRTPSIVVTNAGSIIVTAVHNTNAIGDFGDFSIDVNRKPANGDWTGVSVLVPFDSTRQSYGAVVNNELMVDRNTGRVYLFYGTEKQNVVWWEVATADGDFRYIYSDDDGVTWSDPVSLKDLWDTDAYDYCIPSCTKGITLTDGTLVVPCFCKKGMNPGTAKSYALLLIKPPSGSWYFSSVVGVPGVRMNDECAVVEGTTANEIWLYLRPDYNYGEGAFRGYHKFVYDTANDTFSMVRSTFDTNRHNLLSVDRITISNQLIFLMTFTDTHASVRENITLWASLDGDTWIRVYRMHKEESTGYSVVDNYNGVIVVAYETPYIIKVQNISALSTLISDTAKKYIVRNITVQDRMQMIYNTINGID